MNYLSSKAYVEIFGEAKKGSYIYTVNKKIIKVMKNQKIEKLELKNSKLEDQISELREETRTEVSSFIKKHYFPFVNGIEFDGDTYFRLYDKERNEICSLSLRKNSWEDKTPNHIVIGYYSTQVKSDNHIELDRLVTLGIVSQVIQTRSNEIIEDTRTLSMKNNNLRKKLLKQSWNIEKEISQLEKEDRDIKRLESLNKLFKGVNIKKQSIHVRHDYRISEVKNIKFLSWTNDNKKSLTIELTYEQMKWNQDGNHTFEDRTDVYNKVRLDNLNYIINDLENEIVK